MVIFRALRSPELDLICLNIFSATSTSLPPPTRCACWIAGRMHIPVAHGADHRSRDRRAGAIRAWRGRSGNVHLPPPTTRAITQPAAADCGANHAVPGEITLVPIGPLTNIALALRLEPGTSECGRC
jgi:inosine-uridine nucleoside N-ribohydrolase